MSRRGERRRGATVVVTAALALAFAASGAGLWARWLNGPVWPAVLSDWSLGSALLAWSSAIVGAVVAVRLPRNVVGWLFLVQGVLSGVVFAAREVTTHLLTFAPGSAAVAWGAWVFAWAIPVNMTVLALLVLLFPHGTPTGRRWRWAGTAVVVGGLAVTVTTAFSPYTEISSPFPDVANPVAAVPASVAGGLIETGNIVILLALLVGVASLIRRLRRAGAEERLQVKWFGFAAIVAVVTFIVGIWVQPAFVVATLVAFPGVPIAAGVAILRHRLYDIDRIISRTVAWAVVTVVIGGVYLVAVTVLTQWLAPVTGRAPLAVAAATLLAAAAFGPARQRIQAGVDRRFNRSRYDAEQVAMRYRARLRDEVDLDSLQSELLATVHAAVQPAGAVLWLPGGDRAPA